jgi:hypothetical protein
MLRALLVDDDSTQEKCAHHGCEQPHRSHNGSFHEGKCEFLLSDLNRATLMLESSEEDYFGTPQKIRHLASLVRNGFG